MWDRHFIWGKIIGSCPISGGDNSRHLWELNAPFLTSPNIAYMSAPGLRSDSMFPCLLVAGAGVTSPAQAPQCPCYQEADCCLSTRRPAIIWPNWAAKTSLSSEFCKVAPSVLITVRIGPESGVERGPGQRQERRGTLNYKYLKIISAGI